MCSIKKTVKHIQGQEIQHIQGQEIRHIQGQEIQHIQGQEIYLGNLGTNTFKSATAETHGVLHF